MQFFESTPIGRIINRFSKDMNAIEFLIPSAFKDFIFCAFDILTIIIMISISTPLITTVLLPISLLYFFIQRFYVVACSKLKRLDSVSRSPIFSHFGETINGLTTIKAYKAEERFIDLMEKKIDQNIAFFHPSLIANRWLDINLNFLGGLVSFFASVFAIISRENLTPAIAGLSISFSLSVRSKILFLINTILNI